MKMHFEIAGVLLIFLAFIHVVFPKRFNWKEELKPLSVINREVMWVHTFFIALAVFLMGVLCLGSAKELIETPLGKRVSLGFGIFWAARLLIQFFGYSSSLWKGKIFETTIHIIFSVLWLYLSVIFLKIYFT